MPKRDVLQTGLRLPRSLRDKLQRAADTNGTSLNQEMSVRLDRSLRDEEVGTTLFRGRQRYELIEAFDRILRITELRLGQDASLDDPRALKLATASFLTLIDAAPSMMEGRILAGKVVKFESLRDFIDWQTAGLLDHLLDGERRRKLAAEQEQEQEPKPKRTRRRQPSAKSEEPVDTAAMLKKPGEAA